MENTYLNVTPLLKKKHNIWQKRTKYTKQKEIFYNLVAERNERMVKLTTTSERKLLNFIMIILKWYIKLHMMQNMEKDSKY